jgi:hypothetical protein
MTLRETIRWQWREYGKFHPHRGNLVLHIIAVSLFWAGTICLFLGIVMLSLVMTVASAIALLLALTLQSIGHKQESNPPVPFAGKADFFKRFLAEQFVTFPRFVLNGGWSRNFFER